MHHPLNAPSPGRGQPSTSAAGGGWRGGHSAVSIPLPPPNAGRMQPFPHVGISTCDTCHIRGINPGPGWAGGQRQLPLWGICPFPSLSSECQPPWELENQKEKREHPRRRPPTMKVRRLQDQKRRPRPTPLASSCRHNPTSNRRDRNFKIRALHVILSNQSVWRLMHLSNMSGRNLLVSGWAVRRRPPTAPSLLTPAAEFRHPQDHCHFRNQLQVHGSLMSTTNWFLPRAFAHD